MQILIAAVILGALGLIFGAVIFVASKYLSVPTDPKRDAVRECLPGANCGGCGFAGCDSYADAIAAGKAAPNLCPVGGDAVAVKIADIIGVSAEKAEREVATVICRGSTERCRIKFNYEGIHDCRAAALVSDGDKACPFDAIQGEEGQVHNVIGWNCTGCGKCVEVCPKSALGLIRTVKHSHIEPVKRPAPDKE